MRKRIDQEIAQKFAGAAGILMTRVFSTPLETNQRRLMFACGSVMNKASVPTQPHPKFDVLGLGFRPGKEWKGPVEIFIEEQREGTLRTWNGCDFWADSLTAPLYLLTTDPEVCFSFDGNALVPLSGQPDRREEGIARARDMLRATARLMPDNVEQHTMM